MPNATVARGTTLDGTGDRAALSAMSMDFDSRELLEVGTRKGAPILEFWQCLAGSIAVSTVLGEGTIVSARRHYFVTGQVTVDPLFAGREVR